MIRRLKNHVNNEALIRISDSLFNSKIRYVIQLLGKVRLDVLDTESGEFKTIQKIQNKLIRLLNGTKLSEKKSTKSLIENIGMLSTNQMNAQCKLLDTWKSLIIEGYPFKASAINREENTPITRACTSGMLMENAKTTISKNSFRHDATHIWKKTPSTIKCCKSVVSVKKALKSFVATLPI